MSDVSEASTQAVPKDMRRTNRTPSPTNSAGRGVRAKPSRPNFTEQPQRAPSPKPLAQVRNGALPPRAPSPAGSVRERRPPSIVVPPPAAPLPPRQPQLQPRRPSNATDYSNRAPSINADTTSSLYVFCSTPI